MKYFREKNVRKGRSQRGVGLIEVLVALAVLSIGLLGVAQMQVIAKKSSHEAMQRTLAVFLANDVIARMKRNPAALTTIYAGAQLGQGAMGSKPGKDCINARAPCAADDLARYDLWEWEQALDGYAEQFDDGAGPQQAGGLVDAVGCISVSNQTSVRVVIVWRGLTSTSTPPPVGCSDAGADAYRRQIQINTVINKS
jgi:type IV pilus assembly protein PilV